MATYTGSASWFCCYPDPCDCDDCCCQGADCRTRCGQGDLCGPGGCCTCNTGQWGVAWKSDCPWCDLSENGGRPYTYVACGEVIGVTAGGPNYLARRVDTGPSAPPMIDLTKALFSQMAPLGQGIIPNVTVEAPYF